MADKLAAWLATRAPQLLPVYPPSHMLGMPVPTPGSSCKLCVFVDKRSDGPHCLNRGWVDVAKEAGGGGGDSTIPMEPGKLYCCDLFEAHPDE